MGFYFQNFQILYSKMQTIDSHAISEQYAVSCTCNFSIDGIPNYYMYSKSFSSDTNPTKFFLITITSVEIKNCQTHLHLCSIIASMHRLLASNSLIKRNALFVWYDAWIIAAVSSLLNEVAAFHGKLSDQSLYQSLIDLLSGTKKK